MAFGQPTGDREHHRHRQVCGGVGQDPRRVGDDDAALGGGREIDVVVADGYVGHAPQPGAGGVEQRGVDAVVEHRDQGGCPGGGAPQLVGGQRAVVRGEPHIRGIGEQLEGRLGDSAHDRYP